MSTDGDRTRSRGWCFTWFYQESFIPAQFHTYEDIFTDWEKSATWICIGDETCPTTGRKHFQGAVWWKHPRTFGGMRKLLPTASWRACKGSPTQNEVYCAKESPFWTFGEKPSQGARTDISDIREAIKKGALMREVTEIADSYQSMKMAEIYFRHHPEVLPRRNWRTEVTWVWGPTGVGKTRWVFEQAPDAWVSGETLHWWEGYTNQEDVVFEEFRADACPFATLLRYLDRYPMRVPIKFGSAELLARRIFITSCHPPEHVYKTFEDIGQLKRRITSVVALRADGGGDIFRYSAPPKLELTKVGHFDPEEHKDETEMPISWLFPSGKNMSAASLQTNVPQSASLQIGAPECRRINKIPPSGTEVKGNTSDPPRRLTIAEQDAEEMHQYLEHYHRGKKGVALDLPPLDTELYLPSENEAENGKDAEGDEGDDELSPYY